LLAPTDGEDEAVDEDSATDITEGVPVPRRDAWAARDNDDEKTTAHSRLRGTTSHAEKARGDGEGGFRKILGLDIAQSQDHQGQQGLNGWKRRGFVLTADALFRIDLDRVYEPCSRGRGRGLGFVRGHAWKSKV